MCLMLDDHYFILLLFCLIKNTLDMMCVLKLVDCEEMDSFCGKISELDLDLQTCYKIKLIHHAFSCPCQEPMNHVIASIIASNVCCCFVKIVFFTYLSQEIENNSRQKLNPNLLIIQMLLVVASFTLLHHSPYLGHFFLLVVVFPTSFLYFFY